MSITTTTNRGLLKPDVGELARDYASEVTGSPALDEVAEQNAVILDTFLRSQSLIQFTPEWRDNGGDAFNLGATATELGLYRILPGGYVMLWEHFVLAAGHNVTNTGAAFSFSVPVPIDTAYHDGLSATFADVVGEGLITDSSDFNGRQTCTVTVRADFDLALALESFVGKTVRFARGDMPFTFATGDKISLFAIYKGDV